METPFAVGLRGFAPAPLVSLRTLKADLCLGLRPGRQWAWMEGAMPRGSTQGKQRS